MQKAEQAFKEKTGEDVYFGVGTNGTAQSKDSLGKCYRLAVSGVNKDLIVQAINTGGDVQENQFDLQTGDGGFGAFDDCAGSPDVSMFYDPNDPSAKNWGKIYGGVDNRSDCMKLPRYPKLWGDKPPEYVDNLQDLCTIGFDKGIRLEGGENQTIDSMCEVSCPVELTEITGLIPIETDSQYTCSQSSTNGIKCGEAGLSHCLTRMMDCRKPSASVIDNVDLSRFRDGAKVVQPCGQDGYSRIDNRCGLYPDKETGACYS